jgi:hypothetical protein
MVLGTAGGVCEICGAAADFEVLFAKTTRKRKVDFATVNAELKREG